MFTVTIPGVNKLLGTFSKCCKGPAICTLAKESLKVTFASRSDGCVRVCLAKSGECKKFQVSTLKLKKEDKLYNAVKAVYYVMSQTYIKLPCYDIEIDGDAVENDGSMTYGAVALAVLKAFDQSMNLKLRNEDFVSIADEALICISVIGNRTNLYTMLCAKEGQILAFDGFKRTMAIYDNPFKGTPYSLVILDGHVPVSSLKEEVHAKDVEIRAANQAFMDMYVGCSIMQLNSSDLKEKTLYFEEDTKKYCRYLLEESKAAISVEEMLKNKDISSLSRVFDKVRIISEEILDFICPEANWLIKRAYETSGCLGACVSFAGFRTKVVLVCKNENLPQLEAATADYQHIFGFPLTAEVIGDYIPS